MTAREMQHGQKQEVTPSSLGPHFPAREPKLTQSPANHHALKLPRGAEGRFTGIPKMREAMAGNDSPPPQLITDEERILSPGTADSPSLSPGPSQGRS
jgi:hypothetical protein